MTQTDRVHKALKQYGKRGITQVDFLLPNVIDGGAPITRVGARIKDLKDAGVGITVAGTRDKCVVYTLVASDGTVENAPPLGRGGDGWTPPSADPSEATSLFNAAALHRKGAYDDLDAA